MADVRQEAEEQTELIVNCLRDDGWTIQILPDNSWTTPSESDAEREARFEAVSKCMDELLDPDRFATTEAEYQELYERALDTRDCLADAGYPIDDPPSEGAWVAAAQAQDPDIWVPFQSLIDQAGDGEIELPQEEYYELYDRCPQAGPVAGM